MARRKGEKASSVCRGDAPVLAQRYCRGAAPVLARKGKIQDGSRITRMARRKGEKASSVCRGDAPVLAQRYCRGDAPVLARKGKIQGGSRIIRMARRKGGKRGIRNVGATPPCSPKDIVGAMPPCSPKDTRSERATQPHYSIFSKSIDHSIRALSSVNNFARCSRLRSVKMRC